MEYLQELGWSQAELGRRIKVSETSICAWKNGRVKTPKSVLLYLELKCDILRLTR